MKKFLSLILVLATLISASALGIHAAYFENIEAAANDLKILGLFLGTEGGYELGRAPTRDEAATMLVRLLGKESEAKRANHAHPFTDVPDWASPYIGYLYQMGLTKGISDDLFGSKDLCSLQMFCTFVLRALGYADTGRVTDFSYEEAVYFAEEIGLWAIDEFWDYRDFEFTRSGCVSIMFMALLTNSKNTQTSLLDKLVSEGAISVEAAARFIEKYNLDEEFYGELGSEEPEPEPEPEEEPEIEQEDEPEDETEDDESDEGFEEGNVFDLVQSGAITLEIKGNSIDYTSVKFTNKTRKMITVVIPIGAYFSANSGSVQNMVVRKPKTVTLSANETISVSISTACMNIHMDIPTSKNSFTIYALEENSKLARVMELLEESNASYAVTQAAVWIVTDNPSEYDLLNTLVYSNGAKAITADDLAKAKEIVRAAG